MPNATPLTFNGPSQLLFMVIAWASFITACCLAELITFRGRSVLATAPIHYIFIEIIRFKAAAAQRAAYEASPDGADDPETPMLSAQQREAEDRANRAFLEEAVLWWIPVWLIDAKLIVDPKNETPYAWFLSIGFITIMSIVLASRGRELGIWLVTDERKNTMAAMARVT